MREGHLFWPEISPVGASISLSVQFPTAATGGRLLRMEMSGEVVRVELPLGRKASWGFAVACKRRALNQDRDWGELSPSIQ